uniref:Uncharacterized protein n=1 Tax=Picea glauca TaxID=3330 RepID=A0A101LX15_PICGL|nr:hypothetical protein ABT39_MTgene6386 [Picea glauca]
MFPTAHLHQNYTSTGTTHSHQYHHGPTPTCPTKKGGPRQDSHTRPVTPTCLRDAERDLAYLRY